MIKISKYVFMIMVLFACNLDAAALNPDEEALVRAAATGDATTVNRLLQAGVSPNTLVGEDGTVLTGVLRVVPATDGHLEVIRRLLNAGAWRRPVPPMVGPLHEAVIANNIRAVRMLMREFGFDPRELMGYGDVTAITIAERGSEEMKRLLDPWFGRRVAVIAGGIK